MTLRGKAAIVGAADLKPMKAPPAGNTGWGLCAEAARMAIEDAGLRKEDIDAILCDPPLIGMHSTPGTMMAEYLQIPVRYSGLAGIGGASGVGEIWRAAAAIDAGICACVLCVNGDVLDPGLFIQLLDQTWVLGPEGQFEDPYGPGGANGMFAMIAMRHAYEYGSTDAQRARVAVDQRTNACANPNALFYGRPITVEDVLNSRMVSTPLRLLECAMPCSGASAVIVTSAERAKSLRHPPVYILGGGEYATHTVVAFSPKATLHALAGAAPTAFKIAGCGPKDINLVSIYDCYTIAVMCQLEAAGFCPIGESGPFVEETDMTYKGKLPVNTHGGQLSFGQTGRGMTQATEAVYQLRGQAGERQVPNCDLAFVSGQGGCFSEASALVLGTAATL